MFNLNIGSLITNGINNFFSGFLTNFINSFSSTLANIMGASINVLNMPLVQSGINYAQWLAITLLALKTMNEAFQTYILHQNGDPDADPGGLIIRTAQAVAIIATMPWIVTQIFTFGTKVAQDVTGLSVGSTGISDWTFLTSSALLSAGIVPLILLLLILIGLLIIALQATIRGAKLALVSVLGPIMALNLSSTNRGMWSAWFKQIVIICLTQAVQIFMLKGALSLLTNQIISSNGLLVVFGWIWVTIKSDKFIQQFADSTGFTGTVGGAARQAGTLFIMRKMMGA